jgi:hypothetical protein
LRGFFSTLPNADVDIKGAGFSVYEGMIKKLLKRGRTHRPTRLPFLTPYLCGHMAVMVFKEYGIKGIYIISFFVFKEYEIKGIHII